MNKKQKVKYGVNGYYAVSEDNISFYTYTLVERPKEGEPIIIIKEIYH